MWAHFCDAAIILVDPCQTVTGLQHTIGEETRQNKTTTKKTPLSPLSEVVYVGPLVHDEAGLVQYHHVSTLVHLFSRHLPP